MDPFLGSGTTASVAMELKRKWIGIEKFDHVETHALVRLENKAKHLEETGFKYVQAGNSG